MHTLRSIILVALTLFTYLHAEDRSEPFVLKSSTGIRVKVVAIYKVAPEGLTFSPHPNGPLIGSNKLKTITTTWDKIDVSSFSAYPELDGAYKKATGESAVVTTLDIGPQFNDLSALKAQITKVIPKVQFYINGVYHEAKLTDFITRKLYFKAQRVFISHADKKDLIENWQSISDQLQPMFYRTDVNKLQADLEEAIKVIERFDSKSRTFSVDNAQDIERLLRHAK